MRAKAEGMTLKIGLATKIVHSRVKKRRRRVKRVEPDVAEESQMQDLGGNTDKSAPQQVGQ